MQRLTFTDIQTLLNEELALGKRHENIHHGKNEAGGDKFDSIQSQWRSCTKHAEISLKFIKTRLFVVLIIQNKRSRRNTILNYLVISHIE